MEKDVIEETKEIMLLDEKSISDKIYVVRGQKVMLDVDLAVRQSKALIRIFKKMKDYMISI